MARVVTCVVHVYFPSETDYLRVVARAKLLGKSISRYMQDLALKDLVIAEMSQPGALPTAAAPLPPPQSPPQDNTARDSYIKKQFGFSDDQPLILGLPPEDNFSVHDLLNEKPAAPKIPDTPQFDEQGKASKDILDHIRDQQDIKESMPDEIDLDDLE